MKGGVQGCGPQLQVIIPSAAYAGALISFVLCPSELVKVEWNGWFVCGSLFSKFALFFLVVLLWHWVLQCRMQVQGTDSMVPKSSRYSSPLDCALKTIKTEGVRKSSAFGNTANDPVLSWHNTFQVSGIFRGGFTTLLRESLGNAVFFSVYEYVRYYVHSQLKAASSDHSHFIDMGIGIVSGGLSGVAVSLLENSAHFWMKCGIFVFLIFKSLIPHWFVLSISSPLQFWSAVLPLDVAKTIIQTTPDKRSSRNPFQILSSVSRPSISLFSTRASFFSFLYLQNWRKEERESLFSVVSFSFFAVFLDLKREKLSGSSAADIREGWI